MQHNIRNDVNSIFPIGTNILSLDLDGGYKYEDGTSQATPIVAASLALIISILGQQTNQYSKYTLTARDLLMKNTVKHTALDRMNTIDGLIDIYKVLICHIEKEVANVLNV